MSSGSTENEKVAAEHIEHDSSSSDKIDFGGESSLPPPPVLTPEEEAKLWRKIDLRLMPILSLLYLFSFLGRSPYFPVN